MSQKAPHTEFWQGLFAHNLPKTHLLAAGTVAVFITLLLVMAPSERVSAVRESSLEELDVDSDTRSTPLAVVETPEQTAPAEPATAPEPVYEKVSETVQAGDNLSTVFRRMSLSPADVYAVANASEHARELRRLKPGETISAMLDEQGELAAVTYRRSPLESFRYTLAQGGFQGEKIARQPDTIYAFRHVEIEHSLFLDGARTGLTHAQIMQIAKIFGWDIDFALDIRRGDTFSVLYEERHIDGQKIAGGKVLAANFTNRGDTYRAVRYVEEDGSASYYTPEGKPMKKAFLRAPLDFTRVSSNFNPNRLHPVHKTRRPHRGVDYAASTGTPVYAAGDGRVVEAGYSKPNGNYVFIQHGETYTTKYLHLHKRSVKRGDRVKQRQMIGTVGATGYATGPHLHYEFLVNGTHTNPRTVDLPEAEPIADGELTRFQRQTTPLLAELRQYRATRLASVEQ